MSTFRQRAGKAAPQDSSSGPTFNHISIDVSDELNRSPSLSSTSFHLKLKTDVHRRGRRTRACSISVLGLLLFTTIVTTRSYLRQRILHTHRHRKFAVIARRTVVSIGTVPSRRNDLLKTLDSIFRQTYPPSRVQIHYSSSSYQADDNDNTGSLERIKGDGDSESYPDLDGVIREARRLLEDAQAHQSEDMMKTQVTFHPSDPNWRSATKLLGYLRQEWGGTSPASTLNNGNNGNNGGGNQGAEHLVVVADDDFEYLPTWLESLLAGHLLFPNSAVSLRGWRVRNDLHYGAPPVGDMPHPDGVWGSFPAVESYVIRGANIVEPYRVGVVTGVNGILLRPSFFGSDVFDAPSPDYLSVDDIWYSGILANRKIDRWVVPFIGSGNRDRDVGNHLGQADTVIDGKLKASNRARTNQMVIQYFAKAWERGDGESLWWTKDSVPKLRGFLPFRHWLSEHILLWLYSIGWIRNLVGDWGFR